MFIDCCKITVIVTRESSGFQWGQEKRSVFANTNKFFVHETLTNIEPVEAWYMDIIFITMLAAGNSPKVKQSLPAFP